MIAVEFTSTDMLMTVAIVLLISLSVAIAVAETAVTRISKTRAMALQAEGNKRADKVLYVINNFERSLNAVYLVALGCQTVQAALTGIVASNVFGPWGVAVATVINVLVVFIIAEAAPKTWALQHTDRAALLTAPLVILLSRVFRHIANVLIWVTNLILPGKGLEQGPFVTEEEIIALMGEAAEAAVIEEEERDLIESIIDFGDTVAREIMVPRTDMVTFEAEYRVADCVGSRSVTASRSPFSTGSAGFRFTARTSMRSSASCTRRTSCAPSGTTTAPIRSRRSCGRPTSCPKPSVWRSCFARCRRARPISRS